MKKYLLLATALFTANTQAEIFSANNCGKTQEDSCTWTFDDQTGILSITGKGEMQDYGPESAMPGVDYRNFFTERPWQNFSSQITKVVVEDGITSVGNRAFEELKNVKDVQISDTVLSLGAWTMSHNNKLETISLLGDEISIKTGAISNQSHLQTLYCTSKKLQLCNSLAKASDSSVSVSVLQVQKNKDGSISYYKADGSYCRYQADSSGTCFSSKGAYSGHFDSQGKRIVKKIYTVEEAMEATKNGERFHVFLTYK